MEGFESNDTDWWQRHENHVRKRESITFDLFVRSLGPRAGSHGRQSAVIERLDRLDGSELVDATAVRVWGDSVCVSECCSRNGAVRAIRDEIERFRQWAAEKRHVSVGFQRRAVDSSITDERFEVVDLPTMCLAVYADGVLEGVFPATVGDEEWGIDTYLDWFERTRGRTDATMVADA